MVATTSELRTVMRLLMCEQKNYIMRMAGSAELLARGIQNKTEGSWKS